MVQVTGNRGTKRGAVPDGNTVILSLGVHSLELRQNTPSKYCAIQPAVYFSCWQAFLALFRPIPWANDQREGLTE